MIVEEAIAGSDCRKRSRGKTGEGYEYSQEEDYALTGYAILGVVSAILGVLSAIRGVEVGKWWWSGQNT